MTEEKKENTVPVKNSPKENPLKRKFPIFGCIGAFLVFYTLTVILGIIMLWLNKDNQTFLNTFRILNEKELKEYILKAIQVSFLPVGIILLIIISAGVFKLLAAKKEEKEKKKNALTITAITTVILFIVIPFWFLLYNFVYSLPAKGETVKAEIITIPQDFSKLTTPVSITFDAGKIKESFRQRGINIVKFLWDFNRDDNFEIESLESKISHVFNDSGVYIVKLRVEDKNGDHQIYEKKVILTQASIKAVPSEGAVPLEVLFDASFLNRKKTQIKSFDWDFNGDKIFEIENGTPKIKNVFDKIGVFNVYLRTIDEFGTAKLYEKKITVVSGENLVKARIEITPGKTGQAPFRVQIDGGKSESKRGKIIKYEWDFGDKGPKQVGKNVTHIYDKKGRYTVALSVTDIQGNEGVETEEINVSGENGIPNAKIKTDPAYDERTKTLEGITPLSVSFDASQSESDEGSIVSYSWDFNGDKNADETGEKVKHIFRKSGEAVVMLTVTDADGNIGKTSIKVKTFLPTTEAVILADSETGAVPLTVEFDGSSSRAQDGSNITLYEWDFGDGTPSVPAAAHITHIFEKVGTYTVKLTVHTDKGEIKETSKNIYVRIVPLTACFDPSRDEGTAPFAVSFDANCSTGSIQKWKWEFGDGATSTNRKPVHTFEKSGNYTVTLEVIDNKNNVSKYKALIIAK